MASIGQVLMQSSKNDSIKKLKELISKENYIDAYKYILEIDDGRFAYGQFNPKRNLHSISHKHLLLRELRDNLDENQGELKTQVDKSIEEYILKDIIYGSNYTSAVQKGVAKTISDKSSKVVLWVLLGMVGLALLIVTIFEPGTRLPQTFIFGFGLFAAAIFFIKKNREKRKVLENEMQLWLGENAWIYNLQLNVLKNICFLPSIERSINSLKIEIEKGITSRKFKKYRYEVIEKNMNNTTVLILHWIGELISPLARYTVFIDVGKFRCFSAEITSGENLSIREFNDKGGWVLPKIDGVVDNDLESLLNGLSQYLNLKKVQKVETVINDKEETDESDHKIILDFNRKVRNVVSNLGKDVEEEEVVTFSLLIDDIKFCNTTEKAQNFTEREKLFKDGFESMSSKSIENAIKIRDAYSVILGNPSEYVLGQSFNMMPVADVKIIQKLQSNPYGIVMLHFIDRLNYGFRKPEDTKNPVIGSIVSEMEKFETLLKVRGELWKLILDYTEQ